jgi:hypothetical protein
VIEALPSTSAGTDAIPRVGVEQLLGSLALVAERGRATFEEIRAHLQKSSSRSAPGSREAMWTSTRDTIAELSRLGYLTAGPLPRRRSEVERLRGSPCAITDEGKSLSALYREKSARAYDQLLIAWCNRHPYFRALVARLTAGPLRVPDVTSIRQIGEYDGRPTGEIARRVAEDGKSRLAAGGVPEGVCAAYESAVHARFDALSLPDPSALRTNAKQWVDLVQDTIVVPALLSAESLPFDPVTFQHILRIAQQFVCASWTYSYPAFAGRVVFLTSDFTPSPAGDVPVQAIEHHGKAWAAGAFERVLLRAYASLSAGRPSPYVDAYTLRALVCVDLGIQPKVFEASLQSLARAQPPSSTLVYTELPERPPPHGEPYVELAKQRVGLIKLVVSMQEGQGDGHSILP